MLPPREYIAWHEAGHAVVCWCLECWFPKVSATEGRVECPLLEQCSLREECDIYITVALAGRLAEDRFAEGRPLPAESQDSAARDEAQARRVAGCRGTSEIDSRQADPRFGLSPENLVETLRALTRRLLLDPTIWAGVEVVAHTLLERDPLTYEDVSAILEKVGLMRGMPRELGPWFPRNR